jgi:hypothetical protein
MLVLVAARAVLGNECGCVLAEQQASSAQPRCEVQHTPGQLLLLLVPPLPCSPARSSSASVRPRSH